MANKEITLKFKAKVNTDVGDIKKILANLENQLEGLTIPESSFKNFKNTIEKINKELINFESLTEQGSDNLADTKKIEKSWEKVTTLLYNVQGQLKNMGKDVDIFPRTVLDNISKANDLLDDYNKKLKKVKESEEYAKKETDLKNKKALAKSAQKDYNEKSARLIKQQGEARAAQSNWQNNQQEYQNKKQEIQDIKKAIEAEERYISEQQAILDQYKNSGILTKENKITSSTNKQKTKEQGIIDNASKKQEEYNRILQETLDINKKIETYEKESGKNKESLQSDTSYLNLLEEQKNKTEELTIATQQLNDAKIAATKAEQNLANLEKTTQDIGNIKEEITASRERIQILQQEGQALDTAIRKLESYKTANDTAQGAVQKTTGEVKQAKDSWEQCEQAVEKTNQELKQMEVDQTTQEWDKLVKTIKEITGVDLTPFAGDVDKVAKALKEYKLNEVEKTPSVASQAKTAFNGMVPAIDRVTNAANSMNRELSEAERQAQEIAQVKENIMDFFSISNTIDIFKDSVRNAFDTVKELDAVMTEMAVVTDYSIEDMWGKLPEYSKMASELGVATKEFYEAITLYFQQGLDESQSVELAVETLKMGRIASMEGAEATEAMTAALRGFNMELNQTNAQRVNDVYSKLAAITASDTNQIATAISKTASIASSANMDLETTAAFLAQIIETTQEAPETAGTALKTIISRFSEIKKLAESGQTIGVDAEGIDIDVNKIETALRSVGVSMNDFFAGKEGLDSIFLKLSEKWDTLDFKTQRYIATTAAGSRQQSRFIAMMSDYDRTLELVDQAYDSAGASQEQFDKTMESLSSKLNQLENAWTTFTMGLANSELIKGVITFLTDILNLINNITESLSGSNGLIRTVYNAMILLGALQLGKVGIGKVSGIASSFLTGGATAAAKTTAATSAGSAASKLSSTKALKWIISATVGAQISEVIDKIFNKDTNKEKDKKEEKKEIVVEENNKPNYPVNTTEVVNNYLEGETIDEQFASGILDTLSSENEILNQIEKNTSVGLQSETKTEPEKQDEKEEKTDWGSIISGGVGLISTFGSQMLIEAGAEIIGQKLGGKIFGEVAEEAVEQTVTKKSKLLNLLDKFKKKTGGQTGSFAVKGKPKQDDFYSRTLLKLTDQGRYVDFIEKALDNNRSEEEIVDFIRRFIDASGEHRKKEHGRKDMSIFKDGYGGSFDFVPAATGSFYQEFFDEMAEDWLKQSSLDYSNYSPLDFIFGKGKIGSFKAVSEKVPLLKVLNPIHKLLGNLVPILGVIGPALVAAKTTNEAFKLSTSEGGITALEYSKDKKQQESNAEQDYLSQLNSAKTTYDLLRQYADSFGEGTNEAEWAMAEIEKHADGLLQIYPQLSKYAQHLAPENTSDIFKEENWNKIVGDQQHKIDNAQTLVDNNEEEIEEISHQLLIKNFIVETGIGNQGLIAGVSEKERQRQYDWAEFSDSDFIKKLLGTDGMVSDAVDSHLQSILGYTESQFMLITQIIADSGLTFSDGLDVGSQEYQSAVKALEDSMATEGNALTNLGKTGEDVLTSLWSVIGNTGPEFDVLIDAIRKLANETTAAADEISQAGAAAANSNTANSSSGPTRAQIWNNFDQTVSAYRSSQASSGSSSNQKIELHGEMTESEAKELLRQQEKENKAQQKAAEKTAKEEAKAQEAAEKAEAKALKEAEKAAKKEEEEIWENDFDRLYNLVKSIEEETRQQQRIENRYQLMLRTFNATAKKIYEINTQQLTSLEQQRKEQEELISQRMADITMLQLKNMGFAGYASVEKNSYGDSVLRINWDAIEQITDKTLGDNVKEYVNQLEQWFDSIYEAEDTLIDIENAVLDIKERGREEYLDLENTIKESVENYRQEQIDQLSEINDTIGDTNSKLIDSIQKYVDEQRKQRDNERAEKEIEKKQRRLSYLRQDTSNANQVEILTLQEEITLDQEDYTDTLIDQRISELQEQNELAQEQRQHQIEIAQAQLEHYVATGEIWKEVEQLMADGLDETKGLVHGSRLEELLKDTAGFEGMSNLSQMKWMEETNNKIAQALGWYATLEAIKNNTSNLTGSTNITNNYYPGSVGTSGGDYGGYGNGSYGGSSSGGSGISGAYGNGNINISGGMREQHGWKITIPAQGFYPGGVFEGSRQQDAIEKAKQDVEKYYNSYIRENIKNEWKTKEGLLTYQEIFSKISKLVENGGYLRQYKTGGLANFTGPAWLDGTKAKPEYVLNAVQTKGFLTLVDVLDSIKNHAFTPKTENAVGNTYDIDINIETVKEEADINKIAEKVQKSIVATSQYRSNTIIKR